MPRCSTLLSLIVVITTLNTTGLIAQDEAASAKPTIIEKYNAMVALQHAVADVRKKVTNRSDFLSDYLAQSNQIQAYLNSDAKPEPIERPEQFQDKGQLTYDTALQIVIEDQRAHPHDTPNYLPTNEPDALRRQIKATEELGRGMWNDTLPLVREAEAMTGFVKSQGMWDKFMKWVKLETRQHNQELAAEKALRAAAAREARSQRSRETARMVAKNRERMKREHLERVQVLWDRKLQATKLRTERIYADKYDPRFSYRDNDWHSDRRNGRYRRYNH